MVKQPLATARQAAFGSGETCLSSTIVVYTRTKHRAKRLALALHDPTSSSTVTALHHSAVSGGGGFGKSRTAVEAMKVIWRP